MKKFIVNLFSNRFGIVLATLNVCYFVGSLNQLMQRPADAFFVAMNAPAAASAVLSVGLIKAFLHGLSFPETRGLANFFFAVFIVLQWLVIARLAKTLAAKIRKPKI